jgi:Ca2+-binding RTX toxin-like protein
MTDNYNSDDFNLSNWYLTLPVDSKGGITGAAQNIMNLTDYQSSYFYKGSDGAMVFYAPVAGATTAHTYGARSELRELNPNGSYAFWNPAQGGTMTATVAVNSLPTYVNGTPGKEMIGQIHGKSDELVRLYYDNGTVYFKNDQASPHPEKFLLTNAAGDIPHIALNEKFSYLIDVHGDTLTVKVMTAHDVYSSVTTINSVWQNDTLYFKAGVYLGVTATPGVDVGQGIGAGQVSFYGLDFSHAAGGGLGGLIDQPSSPVVDHNASVSLVKTANNIATGTGNDTITGFFSYLKTGDVIHAGAGVDTIHFLSQSTLTTSLYQNITGVDVLDFSATTGERIILDNRFVTQSDNGILTIAYGAGTLLKLDTSAVDASHSVYVQGSGLAYLADTGNRVFISDANTGKVFGGKGNDDITGGKGNDVIAGGAGHDVFHFSSGGGNDTITDFQAGANGDKLVLSGYAGVYGFANLHFTQQGSNTLLSFGGEGSLLLQGVAASSLTADNFQIIPPPKDDDMAVTLAKTANAITTGSGDDVITGYFSYLKATDVIHAGEGHDTIHFLSQSTLTTSLFQNITGVEVLDFSATTGERVVFDDHFVAQADHGSVTVTYGAGTLLKLDTSAVDDSHSVYVEGSGKAYLADNAGNRVFVSDNNTGEVFGGKGHDEIIGGTGNDVLYGMAGNDILAGGLGADHLSGGAGNDVFKYSSAIEGGDIISDFHALLGDHDMLDLTGLFAANGLGDKNAVEALAAGHLILSQGADGVRVDFDQDGLLGIHAATHIVTLEGNDLLHLDLAAILTAQTTG